MHNISIQSRVTSEDLLSDVLTRYEYPKKRLVRVYDPGVEPVEPNPFKFVVVATIQENGDCYIAGMSGFPGVTSADMKAGFEHLKQFGATKLVWRHKKSPKQFIPNALALFPLLLSVF